VVQKQGDDRIVVQIPGIQDPERARKVVEETAFLEFKITDKTQALERALPKLDQVIKQRGLVAKNDTTAAKAGAAANKGLQGLLSTKDTGAKSDSAKKVASTDSAKAADSLKLQPGGALSSVLEQGQMPGEFLVESSKVPAVDNYMADSAVRAALPPGKDFVPGTDSMFLQGKWYRTYYLVDSKPIITGEYLQKARPNQSPTDGTIVEFEMSPEGGRRFRVETGKHVHDYMAILLDNRVMGRPPIINSAIGTRGQITMGGKDLAAAQDLALVLNAGALPRRCRASVRASVRTRSTRGRAPASSPWRSSC
jgi:preprotein translocase subunit SecD